MSDTLPVHLNPRIEGLSPSPALAINELTRKLVREGREVFKLGFGQCPFPVPEPVVAALRENAHQKDYLAVRGLEALREEVAEYHRRRHGIAGSGARVIIGPGSKELMFLLQLVYDGDLLVPVPAWVSYAPQAEILTSSSGAARATGTARACSSSTALTTPRAIRTRETS